MNFRISFSAVIFTIQLSVFPAFSAWEYTGCSPLQNGDFENITLIHKTMNGLVIDNTLNEPIDLEFAPDNAGNVSFYFVERNNKVKYFNAATNQMTIAATIPNVSTLQNHGLVGIVKDPGFETNHWMYLFYTYDPDDVFRISRYTVDTSAHTFDLASEKPILEIPCINAIGIYHTGGAMYFDNYGDMWISVGDNNGLAGWLNPSDPTGSAERGPANTKSLIGGILRIHPIAFPDDQSPAPGIGSTYTIPPGNFGEYFADWFEGQGDAATAAEYRDPNIVAPENYAKGARNPYTLAIDPVRRWVGWGDCGPDKAGFTPGGQASTETEEHNLITAPAFLGWPYFAGDNLMFEGNKDVNQPVNNSPFNDGSPILPPAQAAIRPYLRQCAMTGPIYRYDGDLASTNKIPPHLNKKWLIMDWNMDWVHAVELDAEGKTILKEETAFPGITFRHPLASKIGPDGAFYVVNYGTTWYGSEVNTNISKVQYTGNCLPATPKLETAGCMTLSDPNYDPNAVVHIPDSCLVAVGPGTKSRISGVRFSGINVEITAGGPHTLLVFSIQGREVFRRSGNASAAYRFDHLKTGVYSARVETERGAVSSRVFVY